MKNKAKYKKVIRTVNIFLIMTIVKLVIIGILTSSPGSSTTVTNYFRVNPGDRTGGTTAGSVTEPLPSDIASDTGIHSGNITPPANYSPSASPDTSYSNATSAADATAAAKAEAEAAAEAAAAIAAAAARAATKAEAAALLGSLPYEDYLQTYSSSLFIGDSLTEGLSIYGYVNENNVIAYKGMTINYAIGEIDNMVILNPKMIFLLLGTNDLLLGESGSQFAYRYVELAKKIRERLPETQVFAQSIFPVTQSVENDRPLLANWRIDEYNNAVMNTFRENGFKYVDVSSKFKDSNGVMNPVYSPDGIHLYSEYYRLWLYYLKSAL